MQAKRYRPPGALPSASPGGGGHARLNSASASGAPVPSGNSN